MTLFLEYAWKTIAKIATDVIEKMDILVSLYFDLRPSNNLILLVFCEELILLSFQT